MVQYDQFATILSGKNALPLRGHDLSEVTPRHAETHQTNDDANHQNGTLHPQLRRLSSGHGLPGHYCTRCHMRRPSQEHRLPSQHDHSPSEESWDGFCPDIVMPENVPPRSPVLHHTRRHSGLCPSSVVSQEQNEGRGSPIQMTMKVRGSGSHSPSGATACHCETVLPVENLSERYGLVEEPATMMLDSPPHHQRRESLEKEAADQLSDIMHEELIADMEARQCRL